MGSKSAPPQPNVQGLAAMQALLIWRPASAGTSTLPSMSATECKKAHRTTVGGVGPLLFSRFQLPARTLPGWQRPSVRRRVDRNPSYGILARLHESSARGIPEPDHEGLLRTRTLQSGYRETPLVHARRKGDGAAALYAPVGAETIIHAPYGRAAVDCALDGKLLVDSPVRLLVDPSDCHHDLTRGTVIV